MKKKTILLDVDEVICFSGYLELVNEFLHTNYTIDDFEDYYIDEAIIPEDKKREYYQFIRTKNQYANRKTLPGALEGITALSKYYDIYICSDCRNPFDLDDSGRIFKNKFDYLHHLIPENIIPAKNYIFTGAKNMCVADIQVDDLVSNLNPKIPVRILFPSYHNKKVSAEELKEKGIIRAGYDYHTGWQNLCNILLQPQILQINLDEENGKGSYKHDEIKL